MVVVNERDMTELDLLKKKLERVQLEREQAMNRLASFESMQQNDSAALVDNPVMIQVFETGLKLSRHEVTNILVTGETGSGKGVLCEFIQKNSPRKNKPFIKINCAALPESLLEAELFGYEKGAFTGARDQGKPGLFELADKGILFLDEIGDMPMSIQSKLLKYLDDYEIMRLGGTRSRKIDCLILAATNQDLDKLVSKRCFRMDLLHRINRFVLSIPPLRQRREDVFILANHFLAEQNRRFGKLKRIGSKGMAVLQQHSFPGNVRELRNIIEQATVISTDENIDNFLKENLRVDLHQPEKEHDDNINETKKYLQTSLDTYEKKLISKAASGCRSSIELASRLGVSQATAFRKMKKFGITINRRSTLKMER
jgi:transcriptional regulator with PAS, ATPase and Fis domain